MEAAREWFGAHRYDVARRAGDDLAEGMAATASELEASFRLGMAGLVSQTALNALFELPPATQHPETPEQVWRIRVGMFASTAGLTAAEADTRLRDDFREYHRLLLSLLEEWRQRDRTEGSCSMPLDAFFAFTSFWCGQCGRGVEETLAELRRYHEPDCCGIP